VPLHTPWLFLPVCELVHLIAWALIVPGPLYTHHLVRTKAAIVLAPVRDRQAQCGNIVQLAITFCVFNATISAKKHSKSVFLDKGILWSGDP
jgi:hypothetical protein